MTPQQIKLATRHLAGTFTNQVTDVMRNMIREDLKGLDFSAVTRAIDVHKREAKGGILNYADLLNEIAAASRPAQVEPSKADREGSWADVYRRQNPQLRDAGDYEVILRVHRGWWYGSRQSEKDRAQLRVGATYCLVTAGMHEAADAAAWAEAIFADPDYFRQCLDDLRGIQTYSAAS